MPVLQRDPLDLSRVDATRLSRIWPGAGLLAAGEWRPEDLGEVLSHQLASPVDPYVAADAAAAAGPLAYRDLLLRQPMPSPEALRRVKDWAKPLMGRDDGDVPREVAGVLYFAAILAARLRLGRRISDLADERLCDGARWALRLAWLDPAAADLFREALAVLGTAAEPEPM